jgi:nucleotide-binding universal stress UspA family protein
MHKILLPVSLRQKVPPVVHQAAALARHFHSEIILLHVLSPLRYPAGVLGSRHKLTERDLRAGAIQRAQKDLDQLRREELEGIAVRCLLLKGDPARVIARIARHEQVNFIALSARRHVLWSRLLGRSVTAKVLRHCDCPVWTDSYLDKPQGSNISIRNVLCAIDLSPHSRTTVSRAAQIAREFRARLTLLHVTAGVEIYGPGGLHVLRELKQELVGAAAKEIAKLQAEVSIDTEVIIQCGDVLKHLNRAAELAGSDLLVIGHLPSNGHLGANGAGYAIARESCIPVLRV